MYVAFEPIPTYDITVTGLGTVTATVNGETAEITNNKLTVKRYDDVVLTATPDAYQYLHLFLFTCPICIVLLHPDLQTIMKDP